VVGKNKPDANSAKNVKNPTIARPLSLRHKKAAAIGSANATNRKATTLIHAHSFVDTRQTGAPPPPFQPLLRKIQLSKSSVWRSQCKCSHPSLASAICYLIGENV
jgi:hypothetical protein